MCCVDVQAYVPYVVWYVALSRLKRNSYDLFCNECHYEYCF
jgi:hypothetical protein